MQATNILQSERYMYRDPYVYNVGISAALAAAGTSAQTFTIDGDSDFFLTKLTVFALVADDGTTYNNNILPAVTVLITDTTSGRRLMNEAVPLGNIAGTAQLPFIWPQMRMFKSRSTIQVDFANISDAVTYSDLELSFIGIKAFYRSPN